MSCLCNEAPGNTAQCPIAFTSITLSSMEIIYSDIERETLDILHRLKKFHNYHFAYEVSIIMDHKLLVAIFEKDVATVSQ